MAPKKREVRKTSEERTSARVASSAAKILKSKTASKAAKSVAASALTQRNLDPRRDLRLDTERLDWLERQPGFALVNDDAGRWAVVSDGMQNVPDNDKAIYIATTFFIKAKDWRPSIRGAIDAAMNSRD